MTDRKIDYRAEGLLFLKLKQAGEKVTQAKFCERRSKELGKTMSLPYFKKILGSLKREKKPFRDEKKRKSEKVTRKTRKVTRGTPTYDWPALKVDFMAGDYKTVAAFGKAHGISIAALRSATRGWMQEKRDSKKKTAEKTIQNLIESRAADKARDMYAETLAAQWFLFDAMKTITVSVNNWKDIKSPYSSREAANFIIDMQKAFEKILPNMRGLEKMTEIQEIFDGLGDGTMDIEQAAIGFVKLGVQMPEPLRVMLQKHQPEETPPDEGEEITEAQIMARRQEMLQEIEVERIEFVAERQKEVRQIKHELAHVDSFAEEGNGPKEA